MLLFYTDQLPKQEQQLQKARKCYRSVNKKATTRAAKPDNCQIRTS